MGDSEGKVGVKMTGGQARYLLGVLAEAENDRTTAANDRLTCESAIRMATTYATEAKALRAEVRALQGKLDALAGLSVRVREMQAELNALRCAVWGG